MPRPRVAAAAIAAGLVVGVAIALPLALRNRDGQTTGTGVSASPTPTSGAQAQARTLYQQALSATRGTAGVHYVATTSGAGDQRTVGDAGRTTGTQAITVDSSFGAEQFSLVLVGGTVYFQGNAAAAEDQLGAPAATAGSLAGKWVSVSSGDGPYPVLQPGITTADQATELPLVPASTKPSTVGGVQAIRIQGTVPAHQNIPAGTAYMDVDPSSHRPIDYVSTVTAGSLTLTSTTTFSAWGTAPSPTAPSGAVAWSTLGATEPPGGYGGGGGTGSSTPSAA